MASRGRGHKFSASDLPAFLARASAKLAEPSTTPDYAISVRALVRARCRAFGVAVPPWAERQRVPKVRGQAPGRRRPKPSAVQPPALPPADASAIEALRAWRTAGEGRIVRVNRDGVELHELGAVRRFVGVPEALAATVAAT